MAESLRVGLKKGFPVVARKVAARPASRKSGPANPKVKAVRELIREVAGMAPYEKRVLDILKTGGTNAEKRAYKFAKRRLGTHKRAQKKREEVKGIYARMRARA